MVHRTEWSNTQIQHSTGPVYVLFCPSQSQSQSRSGCRIHRQRTFNAHASLERIAGVVRRTAAHRIVIGHLAARVQAARARARIDAPLAGARAVQVALGAGRALRPTRRRHTDQTRLARAHRVRVDVAALAVRAARRRHARVALFVALRRRQFGAHRMAAGGRIAGVAGRAAAVRRMVGDVALGARAAQAGARIVALHVAAGARLRAVRVHDALRSAFGVRVAEVFGQAGARAGAVALLADGVDAARRRVARFDGLGEDGWIGLEGGGTSSSRPAVLKRNGNGSVSRVRSMS